MATNYPTSIDSFTNPTSGDTLDSPSHAAQHANINDAMVAVQTKLGVGSGTIGTWTTYTPSFSGVTFSAYTARYSQINNVVHVWFHGTVDTDTGTFEIGMPTIMKPGTTDAPPIGNVYGYDASTAYIHDGYVATRTADVVRFVTGSGASWGTWSNAYPFAWVSGDILAFSVTYEKG